MDINNIEDIYKKINEDPSIVNTLSKEEIEKLLEATNFKTESSEDESVVLSFANMQEKYMIRNVTTALIGFLFQYAHEYSPKFENCSFDIKSLMTHNPKLLNTEDFFEQKEMYDDNKLIEIIERQVNTLKLLQNSKDRYEELSKRIEQDSIKVNELKEKLSKINPKELKSEDGSEIMFQESIESFNDLQSALETDKKVLSNIKYEISENKYNLARYMIDNGLEMDRRIDDYAQNLENAKKDIKSIDNNIRNIFKYDPIYDISKKSIIVPQDFIKDNILDFLKHMFRFDIAKDAVENYDKTKIELIKSETSDLLIDTKDPMRIPLDNILNSIKESNIDSTEVKNEYLINIPTDIKNSLLTVINNIPRNKLQELVNEENYEHTQIELYKLFNEIKPTLENIPSQDFFTKFGIYFNFYRSRIKDVTNTLYPDKPYFSALIQVYKHFKGDVQKQFENFCNENYNKFTGMVSNVVFGKPLIISTDVNEETTKFYSGNNDILMRILDKHAEDEKMSDEMMKNKIMINKAEAYKRNGVMSDGKGKLNKAENKLIKSTGGDIADIKLIKKYAELSQKIKEIENNNKLNGGIMDGITRYKYNELINEQTKLMDLIKAPNKANIIKTFINDGKELKHSDEYINIPDESENKE